MVRVDQAARDGNIDEITDADPEKRAGLPHLAMKVGPHVDRPAMCGVITHDCVSSRLGGSCA